MERSEIYNFNPQKIRTDTTVSVQTGHFEAQHQDVFRIACNRKWILQSGQTRRMF